MSTCKPSSTITHAHPTAVKPASTTTGAASDRPASPSVPDELLRRTVEAAAIRVCAGNGRHVRMLWRPTVHRST